MGRGCTRRSPNVSFATSTIVRSDKNCSKSEPVEKGGIWIRKFGELSVTKTRHSSRSPDFVRIFTALVSIGEFSEQKNP